MRRSWISARWLLAGILAAAPFLGGAAGSCTGGGPHAGSGQRYQKIRERGFIYYGGAGQTLGGPDLPADTFSPTTGIVAGRAVGNPQKANLPIPLRDCSVTLLDSGDILIAGGVAGGQVTDKAFLYNEATGELEELSEKLKVPRAIHTATRLGDTVILMGGVDGNGDPMDSVERFDILTRKFERLDNLPKKRAGHAAVPLSTGEILVVGGAVERMVSPPVVGGNQTRGWRFTNSVDLFRPSSSNQFNNQNNSVGGDPADMQMPRAFHQAIALPLTVSQKDQVIAISGLIQAATLYPATGVSPNAEVYDLATNKWITTAVPGLDKRWAGHAGIVNLRADPTNPNPGGGRLWDVIVYGGLEELFVGQELVSFIPGQSSREMGDGPVLSTQIIRVENTPSIAARVIATESPPRGVIPPLGTGMSFEYIPRMKEATGSKQHLLDRYFVAGGIGTFPPPIGTIMFDVGFLITVNIDPTVYPQTVPAAPLQGIITYVPAGQGNPINPKTNKNTYNSTDKMQSIRIFHGHTRMRGKDGQEGTQDDTVLLIGGKLDPITSSETADIYAPRETP